MRRTTNFYGDLPVTKLNYLVFTNSDPMQLIDELNMIYTTCLMFFATFAHDKSPIYSTLLGTTLLTLCLSITVYYHYVQDPLFHQVMYALLTVIVVFRSMWLMEVNLRPTLRKKRAAAKSTTLQQNGESGGVNLSAAETARIDARDAKILKMMWKMVAYGLSVFLGGFALWALDIKYCSTLRRWRRDVGLPWGVVLEGHGWW
jgi:dihydroceramidase